MTAAPRSCSGCAWAALIDRAEWGGERLRCLRDRTLKLGPVSKHLDIGSDPHRETDDYPEPHRVAGDGCGPGRTHWKSKDGKP